ncbi:hypothetical protein [Rhodopseudomonas sp.]|uniref:hypothetical protein n=1 Tax=Rhodopseudomonas sp. TaxID=1078 RepID=UPI003B3ABE57
MTAQQAGTLELNLADLSFVELEQIGSLARGRIIFYLPLPSINRTNMHVDICSDYIDAIWAARRLSAHGTAPAAEEVSDKFNVGILLTLLNTRESIRSTVEDCILIFQGSDDDAHIQRSQNLRNEVADFEDAIDDHRTDFPDLVDTYYANLINGAYDHYKSEAPEFYIEQIRKHPERQLGFHKSALSWLVGHRCYASQDGWLLPSDVPIDDFFAASGQRFRISEFVGGEIFSVGGQSFVQADGITAYFPMNQYFKSRVCASFDLAKDDDAWATDPFEWLDASFTHSPYLAEVSAHRAPPLRELCSIHQSGSLIIVNDGSYRHLLYDTKPLNGVQVKRVHDELAKLSLGLMARVGLGVSDQFKWERLSDEQFELLCYDLLVAHPKFDADTVRKLGKSRSRDGGRDIEVRELPRGPMHKPKKWIFQCKLINGGSSLSGRKVNDIGDMLDMYSAEGFGVMTNAPIDATLYDKCEAICTKRGIEELHFSILEIERALVSNKAIRERYFPELLRADANSASQH